MISRSRRRSSVPTRELRFRYGSSVPLRVALAVLVLGLGGGVGLGAQAYDQQALVEAALEQNPAHQGARAEVERSREQLRGARAERLPSLSVSAGLAYLFNPIEPVRVSSEEISDLTGVPATGEAETITVFEGQEDTQYQFQANLEQPIYTWGKIDTGIRLAEVGTTAASLSVERSALQLQTEVVSLFYSLHYLSRVREELEKQEEAAERLVRISRESFESGAIVEADLLEARVQAAEVGLAGTEVNAQIEQSLAQLRAATSLNIDEVDDLSFNDLSDLSRSAEIPPIGTLLARAESKSAELALLESQVQAAELQRDLADAGSYFKPDIGLQLQLQFAGPRFPFLERDWYRQDQPNNTVSIGLQTTVFDGGRIASDVATEEIDVGAARLDLADARGQIERAVRETRSRVLLDRARVEQAELREENARVQLDLRKREWDNGAGTETAYLRQLIDYHGKVAEKQQQMLQFHIDYFQLLAATGQAP